jgi:hypothetical protein
MASGLLLSADRAEVIADMHPLQTLVLFAVETVDWVG